MLVRVCLANVADALVLAHTDRGLVLGLTDTAQGLVLDHTIVVPGLGLVRDPMIDRDHALTTVVLDQVLEREEEEGPLTTTGVDHALQIGSADMTTNATCIVTLDREEHTTDPGSSLTRTREEVDLITEEEVLFQEEEGHLCIVEEAEAGLDTSTTRTDLEATDPTTGMITIADTVARGLETVTNAGAMRIAMALTEKGRGTGPGETRTVAARRELLLLLRETSVTPSGTTRSSL